MGKAVVVLHGSSEVKRGGTKCHSLFLITGIVDGHSACLALQFLDVLHHDVALTLLLCHVGLQMQWVLVQGNQVAVAEQLERLRSDVACVASDE